MLLLLATVSVVQAIDDDEARLMNDLFKDYNPQVRPALNSSLPVKMTFGIAYVQLVKLDDREQTMISNVWIRQKWHNYHLRWNPEKYNNITRVNVDPKKTWLPDIVLYNNAMTGTSAGIMYSFKTKVEIHYDGLNIWYSPAIIRSGCNIDITFFPFDNQLCALTFGSWTFSGYELDLFRDQDTADLSFYQKSAEFDLVSAKSHRKIVRYSCCPTPYPNIVFTIHLQRQPGFFLFNIIIPGLVITCFAILTFASPHSTGERIGLSIQSFLSLSFLCLMVADSIPVNSDVSPLITKFLLLCMSLISLTVLFNLASINMTSKRKVPRWMRAIVFNYLGPLLGFCEARDDALAKGREERAYIVKTNQRAQERSLPHANQQTADEGLLHQSCALELKSVKKHSPFSIDARVAMETRQQQKHLLTNGHNGHANMAQAREMIDKNEPSPWNGDLYPLGVSMQDYHKTVDDMDEILYRSWLENDVYYNREFWRCTSQVVDRIFMILFTVSFIFVSAVMLLKGYGHQLQVQAMKTQ